MGWISTMDTDHVLARLHGRRSTFAEGERLRTGCNATSLDEFAAAFAPSPTTTSTSDLAARWNTRDTAERATLAESFHGPQRDLLRVMTLRDELEHLKQTWRARNPAKRGTSEEISTFAQTLPAGLFRESLNTLRQTNAPLPMSFVCETEMERAYHVAALACGARLPSADRVAVTALFVQDAASFLFLLAIRIRFGFARPADGLERLHIDQPLMDRTRFRRVLFASDLTEAARLMVGRVFNEMPAHLDIATLEALTHERTELLARRVFRTHPMDFPAAVAFVFLRRADSRRLVTLAEGHRLRLRGPELLQALEHHRSTSGGAHV